MDTIQNNVNEAIASLNAIRDKIVEKGVDVAEGTKPRLYANKVDDVYEAGKKAEYDEWWDNYLATPKKTGKGYCLFAGVGWNENTKIPYKIDFITDGYNMFTYSGNIPKTEIAKIDFSKITSNFPNFNYSSIQHIPELDIRGMSSIGTLFAYASSLISIDNIILRDDGSQTISNLFFNNINLEEIRFAGIIGQNGFDIHWSTKLTADSLKSIINALSTTTTGLTITLPTTAQANYEAVYGSGSWATLVATRSNWTIAYA